MASRGFLARQQGCQVRTFDLALQGAPVRTMGASDPLSCRLHADGLHVIALATQPELCDPKHFFLLEPPPSSSCNVLDHFM
ncbi:MAG: hypothetical protein WAM97_00490 [Acidimicrobiales bacterium]